MVKLIGGYIGAAVGYALIQMVRLWRIFLGTLIVVLPFIILAKLIFE
jgi:uncharacterized membrane protein (Fun14 family)